MLSNRIQALTILYNMVTSTILLNGMLLLFHQIDDITVAGFRV